MNGSDQASSCGQPTKKSLHGRKVDQKLKIPQKSIGFAFRSRVMVFEETPLRTRLDKSTNRDVKKSAFVT
jgi:hypothetical protein